MQRLALVGSKRSVNAERGSSKSLGTNLRVGAERCGRWPQVSR